MFLIQSLWIYLEFHQYHNNNNVSLRLRDRLIRLLESSMERKQFSVLPLQDLARKFHDVIETHTQPLPDPYVCFVLVLSSLLGGVDHNIERWQAFLVISIPHHTSSLSLKVINLTHLRDLGNRSAWFQSGFQTSIKTNSFFGFGWIRFVIG